MLIDSLAYQYVNGFCYSSLVPVEHSQAPERFQRAEEVFRGKLWREQLREWDETFKPASVRAHRELQSVDPGSLSGPDLVTYLTRCRDHHMEMIYQHMRFTGAPSVPTGDFLAHVGDWTGMAAAELVGLLRGAAPVSAGASVELERLKTALAQDASARRLLESDDEPGQSAGGPAGPRREARRRGVGVPRSCGVPPCRRFRYFRALRARAAGRVAPSHACLARGPRPLRLTSRTRLPTVRAKVPEVHRDQFDELLEEARLTYKIRDERGVFSDIWASGIMRRAVLGCGRRLESEGRAHDAQHLVDADIDEMRSLLSGATEPSADELAARFELRTSLSAKDAPQHLGDPPSPPPDPSQLPPGAGRMMRAMGIVMGEMFGASDAKHETDLVRGIGASPGVYEGPVRRVTGPSDFDRIVKGDVLVTESTSEAFNILLPLLGAIVTDRGGLLSHAAIVAREYGIPSVVGTARRPASSPTVPVCASTVTRAK